MNEEDDKQGLLSRMFGGWNRLRENPIADIALGFTPAGVAADVQDAARAIKDRDALGLGLAGLGFIPGVGDVAKNVAKAAKGAEAAPRVLRLTPVVGPQRIKSTPSTASSVNERILENIRSGESERASLLSALGEDTRYGFRPERTADPNLATLQSLLEARVQGVDPRDVAREYIDAARRGVPLDPASIERRASEMFPVRAYHGTRNSEQTADALFNLQRPDLSGLSRENRVMRAFFTGINEGGQNLADQYRAVGKFAMEPTAGTVLPLRVNPGRTLDFDARGALWTNMPVGEVIESLVDSGVAPEDILDAIEQSRGIRAFDYFSGPYVSADQRQQFQDYLFESLGGRAPRTHNLEQAVDLTTDDLATFADELGYDSTIIRDVVDTPDAPEELRYRMPGFGNDVMVVHNPVGRVRHESAVFDPERIRDRNIFAGAAGATIGGTALSRFLNRDREER